MDRGVVPQPLIQPKVLHFFGGLVLIASCLFLAWQVMAVWQQLPQLSVSATFIWAVAVASAAYTGMLSLLAVAWWRLVQAVLPDKHLPLGECWRIFMRTQAPKYLPGNIFHYIGRMELMQRRDIARTTITLSLLHESFLLMTAALLLGAVGLWQTVLGEGEIMGHFALIAFACLAALPLLWFLQRRRVRDWGGTGTPGQAWLAAGALYGLFFLLMAAILWLLAQLAGHALPIALCLAAATVPWLLGFVTPGAPGGLGVREAAMFMLLKPVMTPADGLLLVLALRLVTLFGDLWALPLSYMPIRFRGEPSR